ncbi:MAG: flavodoxin [Candidatus Heteroscillospira sp.]
MKRIFAIMAACLLVFSLTACGGNSKTEAPSSDEPEAGTTSTPAPESPKPFEEETAVPAETATKELVVYFSWSGNTKGVAQEIANQTGADIFEITPETPYSDDYDTVVDLARQEQSDNARPVISGTIENLEDYDVIYVGYPNWWGDMPMILYTFFDIYDLSGKTIAPFCTSGGSGLSNTVSEIQSLEPDAAVIEGLHIRDSSADSPAEAVAGWLQAIE